MKNEKSLMGGVRAPGMHGRTFCSKLMLNYWNKSLRAVDEKVENVEGDLKRVKKNAAEIFEVGSQTLFSSKALRSTAMTFLEEISYPRLLWQREIQLWRKEAM